MTTSEILHKFENVRASGKGWSARCPAHDDQRNSLSIGEGSDGRPLVHCHAGCSFEDICAAAGIEPKDFAPSSAGSGKPQIVGSYDYRDEHGNLLRQVQRLEPKNFLQRAPDGNGGWKYKLDGVPHVPYRLPELLAADPRRPVFIVEGEKDADRLASLGFVATTNVGGAGKWRAENSEYLRGQHVVIIPDNDEPGSKHAKRVEQSLRGVAASVRVLKLHDLPPKGDVSDWLDAGHTADELCALAAAAPGSSPQKTEGSELQIVCIADVISEVVRWLWFPYIALGKLTIVEGDPGLGKSWLMYALAAAVSLGRGLPGLEVFEPGNVLILSAEDGLGDTIRPRLEVVGADMSRVFALAEPLTLDTAGLLLLEAAIIKYSPVLVIIDPVFAFTGSKADIYRPNEARAFSAPLAAIAERAGCAIAAIRHLGKSRGGGHALSAGIGSIDFTAAARSVLLVGQDPDDASKRALVQTKNNLAPCGDAIGYKIEAGRFYWTGPSTLTAARILSLPSNRGGRVAGTEAIEFLREALSAGPRPSKEVMTEAKKLGITEYKLRKAKEALGIEPYKEGGEFGGKGAKWIWELPDAQDVEVVNPSTQDVDSDDKQHLVLNQADNLAYANDLPQDVDPGDIQHLVEGEPTSYAEPDWLSDHLYEVAERAAIMEYDGGLDRAEAERLAGMWEC